MKYSRLCIFFKLNWTVKVPVEQGKNGQVMPVKLGQQCT